MLVLADAVRAERALGVGPGQRRHAQEGFDARGQRRQHRLEVDRQQAEGLDADRADVVQHGLGAGLAGQLPGLLLVDVGVDAVGQRHDLAHRLGVLALLVELLDAGAVAAQRIEQRAALDADVGRELAAEAPGQEAGSAAGDVDVLADQVGVDARDEVLGGEVDVLDAGVELGREVVAQPVGVHAQLEVAQRADAGAAALAHLLAADRDEAVHMDMARRLAAAEVQHRRPEQRVEVGDVLADEVHLLDRRVGQIGVEVAAAAVEPGLQRREVAHRRVEPDIEVFARRVGDLDAEVRRVAADVPVGQRRSAVGAGREPFADLVEHFGLQPPRGLRPLLQELDAVRRAQAEEVVLAAAQLGCRARQRRVRVLQLGGRVDRAAGLAGVAVLVARAAARALALDVAVGQEHALDRVVVLLDGADLDQAGALQRAVDVARQRVVLGRVGRVPVVEAQMKALEVRAPPGGDLGDELLRRLAGLLGGDHDRCAMRVVGADEMHLVALHAQVAHPDVGLDVLHDVADVQRPVGVRQRGGHEQLAGHGRSQGPVGPGF